MLHTHTHSLARLLTSGTHTSTGRQTHYSHVYTVKTHTHVHIAQIHKNVQSKQTRRGLTANDFDNTNWSDPSLLLGQKMYKCKAHAQENM